MSMRDPIELFVERCPDGYLKNKDDWSESLAWKMASEWNGLDFSESHMPILHFIRDHHETHQITPDVREATHFLIENGIEKKAAKKHLFKLFPNGYMQQGIQLAGMRRPTAWCVG